MTVAAWDQTAQRGFMLTAVPNTQRGIQTQPYDMSELLIELEEHEQPPRYFAVRGCVPSNSTVARYAPRECDHKMYGCKLVVLCEGPSDSATVELNDGGASFHTNLLSHCGGWQNFFEEQGGGMQLHLGYDTSEGARLLDTARGTIALGMSTFVGDRPNYGDGTNCGILLLLSRQSVPRFTFLQFRRWLDFGCILVP